MDGESNVAVTTSITVVILALLSLFSLTGIEFVNSGEIGIVQRYGKIEEAITEGGYYYNPFTVSIATVSIKTEKLDVDVSAASKDLQQVSMRLAVNHNIDSKLAVELYKTVGEGFIEKLLIPMVNEQVKSATAKFTAEELITKREEVKTLIVLSIKEKAQLMSINVSDISIVNVEFSPSFNQAIENKVKAEQEALTVKNNLERTKYEAQQAEAKAIGEKKAQILKAEGEAEAIRIQSAAVMAQGGEDYVKLKWIEKWNGTLPATSLGSSVPMVNIK